MLELSAARRPSFGTVDDIPPFSSYGGILGAVPKDRAVFLDALRQMHAVNVSRRGTAGRR